MHKQNAGIAINEPNLKALDPDQNPVSLSVAISHYSPDLFQGHMRMCEYYPKLTVDSNYG